MVNRTGTAINLTPIFITVGNAAVRRAGYADGSKATDGDSMYLPAPFLSDRAAVEDAHALIRMHGEEAGFAAAARAEQYRALGNHIYFARWRQIERLITYLAVEDVLDTVH
jgi:hypothetical protein